MLSQLKALIRTNYSNPPTHGAQVVATVLTTPALRSMWEEELAGMRMRIRQMRELLVQQLEGGRRRARSGLHPAQKGMFSYSGLSAPAMQRLRSEFGVYGIDSGSSSVYLVPFGLAECGFTKSRPAIVPTISMLLFMSNVPNE